MRRPSLPYWIFPIPLLGVSLAGIWLEIRTGEVETLHPSTSSQEGWNVYDDRSRGGGSRCELIAERDTLRAAVRTGLSPDAYWGLERGPGTQGNTPSDLWSWSSSDSLIFVWKARHAFRQRLFVCSRDPDLTTPVDPLTRRYLTADLPVGPDWTRSSIALSELEPPAWWLGLHPRLPHPRKAYLQSILVLQIGPASGSAGMDDTLEIASIERKPGARRPFLAVFSVLGVLGSLVLFFLLWRRKRSKPALPVSAARLGPRPLEIPLPDLDRLNGFLANHYSREDLDLATVATELGLPLRRVTLLLNGSGESFKAVLNRLRQQEARRLLQETDLQVSEIAYKVGYGNVSHFNRMFREHFGTTPGAMRTALRNLPDPMRNLRMGGNDKDSTIDT